MSGTWICDADPVVDPAASCIEVFLTASPWGAFAAMDTEQALSIVALAWAVLATAWGFKAIRKYIWR